MRRLLVLMVIAMFSSVAFADTKEDKAAQELAKKEEKAKKAEEAKKAKSRDDDSDDDELVNMATGSRHQIGTSF